MTASFQYLEPIYGNGWLSGAASDSRDVPSPFSIESEVGFPLTGTVIEADHEFFGAIARLSPRYVEPSNFFNVTVERQSEIIAIGYVRVV